MASRTTTDPIEILLEMGVDLDNLSEEEDYLSALMETVNTLQIKDASDPRIGFLADEIRKVRQKRKAADPKFKAKKTKISADSFKKKGATTASLGQRVLPPAIKPKTSIIPYVKPDEVDEEEESGKRKKARTRKTDKEQNLLEKIAKSVSNITNILKDQYGLKKKKAAYDRKKAEAEKRKLKESNLEKRFQGLATAAEKIIAPVKSALDGILDFFLNIIIGRFLVKFIGWFGDPKNKEKVDSVVRFLVDHGPKLLAAFLLFGTSIGRFAVRLSAMLLKGALRLGAAAAKFALRFAMANPAAAAITAIVGGAALGAVSQANTQSNDPDAPEGRTQLEDTMDYGGVTGDPFAGAFRQGGTIPYYNDGGGVSSGKITTNSGSDITGAGPDTQLIAAQPGEIVINKKTVDAVGSEHFLGLNQQYGGPGANKPKTATVQTASEGGFVLPAFSAGGYVSGTDTGKRGTPDPKKEESSGGPSGPVKSSIVLALKNGVQGKLNTATGKFTPAEFTKAERARYIKFGGAIPETKPKAEPQNKLLSTLAGAATGAATGAMFGGPLGALIGGVAGGVLGSGILSGESDPNKPKRSSFPTGRSGGKKYNEAMKKYRAEKQQAAAEKKKVSDANKPKRSDFPMGRVGGKAYSEALKKHQSGDSTTAQSTTPKVTPKATTKTLTKEQLLGKSGTMPTAEQLSATANKRHAELMKSTDQKKIAAYDKKHGEGAYSQKLKEKLYRIYGNQSTGQTQPQSIKPTGKVVGRENLPRKTQEALARMDAKKGLPPDMQYTRNGKNISAEEFNRTKNMVGAAKEGGAKGVLDHMVSGAKGMFGGMFGGLQGAVNDPKSFVESMGGTVKDGNIGTPTAQEQKDFDTLAASKAKLKQSQQSLMGLKSPKKPQDDHLFAEYQKAYDDPKHPLHDKVSGDLFDDTGTKNPMRFSDFKKFKAEQSQAKLSPNQPSPAAPPTPPSDGGSNVKVVRMPSSATPDNPNDKNTGGSDVNAVSTGNGNKAKWNILGIPMPF